MLVPLASTTSRRVYRIIAIRAPQLLLPLPRPLPQAWARRRLVLALVPGRAGRSAQQCCRQALGHPGIQLCRIKHNEVFAPLGEGRDSGFHGHVHDAINAFGVPPSLLL